MDVRTMERGEGRGIGNSIDRGRVDVVVDAVDKMSARYQTPETIQ